MTAMPLVQTPEPQSPGTKMVQRNPSGSIVDLFYMAVEKGTPVAELKELVALHAQMSERQAQQDFAAAMAAFQAKCPSINKGATAKFATRNGGEMSYTFAPLDDIAAIVNPILAEYGLSYNWDAVVTGSSLTCVCTVRHCNGASTTSSVTLPTDSASAMSSQQKVGSAFTFARRLSLTAALGLTTTDDDTDGRDDKKDTITEAQQDILSQLLAETDSPIARFLEWAGVPTLADIPVSKYSSALVTLRKRVEKKAAP